MSVTVRIDEDVKKRLKMKSAESGISQYDLVNDYVSRGLDEDENEQLSFEEMRKFLAFDREKRDDSFDDVIGIVSQDEIKK